MQTLTSRASRRFDVDDDWRDLAEQWCIRSDTTYLNHGSFGPSPEPVRLARLAALEQQDRQPMDFYVRHAEPRLIAARNALSNFVGTRAENMVLVDNATFGMNVVAASFRLNPGDEVLLNNHEYGAVIRIWQRAAERQQAVARVAQLPPIFDSPEAVVDALFQHANERTRLIVVSHITSATALLLPVQQICQRAKSLGIAVCIDGPHAPAQIDLNLDGLDCDFYTASCHKWLAAPLGTGFLYVHPRWQNRIEPLNLSWGRLLPEVPRTWDEEFLWTGTRDITPYLGIEAAIEFLSEVGLEAFRKRTSFLARRIEQQLTDRWGTVPLGRPSDSWYGSMAHVLLPPGNNYCDLQHQLWQHYRIEVPIILHEDRWYIRVSCHLYTVEQHLKRLLEALEKRKVAK